ncbi:zinc finger BED domain-containing protein RICESLEEPER 2 [Tanacetum coccineum]
MSNEYERYVNSDFVHSSTLKSLQLFDILRFWKENETMFPVLSRMTMDIISVQASSVASESAFSTMEGVVPIPKTRLTPHDEVQRNEAIPLSDEEIALGASSEDTLSPGGPWYDYMINSEAEDE